MKFTNGFWLNKEGYQIFSPAEANNVHTDGSSITVLAPCSRVAHRGDTLQGPVLTVHLSSPIPDVIHVRVCHFKGGLDKSPKFEINGMENPVVIIENDGAAAKLTSGSLSVRIGKTGGWSMDFYGGNERITGSGFRHMAYIKDGDTSYMREQLDLSVGECVYGMGERFTPFVKNGQTVDIWNADGGTCTEQAYKNIPFYVTNKGYGVFVNHLEKVSFETASEVVSRVQFSVTGETLEYFIINGPAIKDVLRKYTGLTGRPALPPAWSFGLWLSTSFTTDYDEKTVTGFVDGMAERGISLSVFHFDCFWMKEFSWCNFIWDNRVFPDPEGMLKRLKAKGLRVCVWINSYIAQESCLFDEAMGNGYLLKRENGEVWQWDLWQPGMGIVDFTNPAACEWFSGKLSNLVDMGVDCFKTDFGERIPTTDVAWFDGSDPVKMHNYYTYLYNKTVFDTLKKKKGEKNAIVFARSATASSQQFPVHWGGDCSSNYQSMAESLRGGLSLCMSGFGFWSHDIGGFESTSTADVYKRWIAFGLLSSHSRLHGSSSYRVPWAYDEEAVDVLRFFTKLKCRLMPYIFKTAIQAAENGTPCLRAMVMEFQDDPSCTFLDRQYMLGDSLLVAPVFSEMGEVSYYLPKGRWVSLISAEALDGDCWRKEKHGYLSLPLLLRPNSIVALGGNDQSVEYDYAQGTELNLGWLDDGAVAETTVYTSSGTAELHVTVRRCGRAITVNSAGAKPWSLRLFGASVQSVIGGTFENGCTGAVVIPDVPGVSFVININCERTTTYEQ